MSNIEALRAALAAGPTPGPWGLWGKPDPSQVISAESTFLAQTVGGHDAINAAYIAAACNAAPDLLAELDRLKAERDALRSQLAGMVTLLETLRTVGESRYCYVQARAGQMVHVADAIDAANAALKEPTA